MGKVGTFLRDWKRFLVGSRDRREMEGGVSFWPALMLSSILGWAVASSLFDLTRRVRALTQPWVTRRVLADTPSILRVQVNPKDVLDFLFLYRENFGIFVSWGILLFDL